MTSKGSAFGMGGCGCLVLFALAAFIAVLAGGHAHADVGGLLVLFLIGGIVGLIVLAIYNKGRKDAVPDGQPKEPSQTDEPAVCSNCGAVIPSGSPVCPKCGSMRKTA